VLLTGICLTGAASAHAQDGAGPAKEGEAKVAEDTAAEKKRPPPLDEGPSDVMRYPPTRVRVPLILGGLSLTAAAYAIGAGCATGWPTVPGSKGLYAPVVGPWIALASPRCAPENPDCSAILYVRGALYVLSGLVQLGGLAIAAEGIFATTEAEAPEAKPKKKAHLQVMPLASPQVAGLGVAGTF
jgi:hypothetical protein